MDKTLYIIDSYALIYRYYYAFITRPLVNEKNENTSGVYGYFSSLLSLIKSKNVTHICAAFDSREKTFRHKMYPEYKAQRKETPPDLHAQVPVIKEILQAFGVKVLQKDGYEADDVIATVGKRCKQEGWNYVIFSSDKDLMQLVDEKTSLIKKGQNGDWENIGVEEVRQSWSVEPSQMLDILSLVGDSADNIPGVKGIGDKTAVKLLVQYGSLDAILENADKIGGSTGKKIQTGIEDAKFSRELIKLCYDVPLDFALEDFSIKNADYENCYNALLKAGIPTVAKTYRLYGAQISASSSPSPAEAALSQDAVVGSGRDGVERDVAGPSQGAVEPVELTENTGNYTAITDEATLNQVIDGFLAHPQNDGRVYVAYDSETDGLNVQCAKMVGFSLCAQERTSYYVPFVTKESFESEDLFATGPDYVTQEQAFKALKKLFFNPNVTILMHNAKFDLEVLVKNGFFEGPHNSTQNDSAHNTAQNDFAPSNTAKIYDTMIASWLLQSERASNSLEKLAETKLHLKTIPFEAIVPKGRTFFDVPLETAVKYGAEDSDLTLLLWNKFRVELENQNLMALFENLEMPLIPVLVQMELTGIHIEKTELANYGQELREKIQSLQNQIYELCGHEFNIASPKQLSVVLFEEKKLSLQDAGIKNKKNSTDSEVLEALSKLDPVPQKVLEFRKYSKLLSTYVDSLLPLADKNDRLHTTFMQTGTATGRLSSRDPNLQNIPVREEDGRRIRQSFSSTDGNVLISADYSQIELVVLAHLSHDEKMCSAFQSGIDVHKATASMIFDVPFDQVTPSMRRVAKTINFGVIYGMSATRLSQDLEISRKQASDFINQYFEKYIGVKKFISDTISECELNGFVQTIFQRKRYIPSINSNNHFERSSGERMAVNSVVQGSASDIVKVAMINLYRELKAKFPAAKMLLQVHDEIIVECPQNISASVAALIQNVMESAVKLDVPLKVSVEIGKRWGEFH